jgi:transposase
LVTVFQMLERVPDRLAAELVVSRIDWKNALHLPIDYAGYHFTDLLAFRKRLLEHQQERVFFEGILERLQSLGLIKGKGKVRTDSTHVLGLVEKLGRMELVTESVRVAVGGVQATDAP